MRGRMHLEHHDAHVTWSQAADLERRRNLSRDRDCERTSNGGAE